LIFLQINLPEIAETPELRPLNC